jgi:hypothetical protein
MSLNQSQDAPRLYGRLIGATGKTDTARVEIRLAVQLVNGEASTSTTTTDDDGEFQFDLPTLPAKRAHVTASVQGATPVDLAPEGQVLETGEVVLIVDDQVPSHIRHAG